MAGEISPSRFNPDKLLNENITKIITLHYITITKKSYKAKEKILKINKKQIR